MAIDAKDTGMQSVVAAGRRLQARFSGPGAAQAPTLVFLHEGLGCIELWRDFPDALATACGCNALVYDRYGYGGSEALQGARQVSYLRDEARDALPEVLDAFEIERALLVGHSDGGSIALLAAALHPKRVAAVIVEAAHLFVEAAGIESIRAAVEAYRQGSLRERLQRYHGANTEGAFRGWADIWLSPEFLEWNIEAEIAGVRCPVLALQGTADEYGTPAQLHAIARAVSGPVETAFIEGCGHALHHEGRERVLEAMTRFVMGLAGPAGSALS